MAKNVVAAGLADRCELQVAYAIGTAHPVSLMVETFGTASSIPPSAEGVREIFDFRPAAIIHDLDLAGRSTADRRLRPFRPQGVPWEATDRVDALRSAVGA